MDRLVKMLLLYEIKKTPERFVSIDRQSTPLSGCRELEAGDILSIASSPLLHVSLESLAIHNVLKDVPTVAEPITASAPPATPAKCTTPDPFDDPSPDFLC